MADTPRELSALSRLSSRFSADKSETLRELSALPRLNSRFSADKSDGTGRR
jgi:hypothetical protein